ncbi:MAG: hypothetical protein HZA54_09600 [Planctomycetes bacterium]|nr:hypothetical protein [Planctomycetota bacterium]
MPDPLRTLAEFLYLLPLALWLGGMAAVLLLHPPRAAAGAAGFLAALRRFDRLRVPAALVLGAAAAWKWSRWEANTGLFHVRYTVIALLIATGLYSALAIAPRLAALERGLPAADVDAAPAARREAFRRLERLAVGAAWTELGAAVLALLLSCP